MQVRNGLLSKKLVKLGDLDKELISIYEDAKIKAETLLSILEDEEEKRTQYTYKSLPQANKQPAESSIENTRFFVSHIKAFLNKKEQGGVLALFVIIPSTYFLGISINSDLPPKTS